MNFREHRNQDVRYVWLRTGPTGPGPPEREILPSHVVTLTSRRSTLPPAMRTGTTPPSPTRDAASLRSRSRSPRARSPRPTTARPRTAPPTDVPRESAGVLAPSCPCSWPPAPSRPTMSPRPTATIRSPSPPPSAVRLHAHPTLTDPRAMVRPRLCERPRIYLPRTRVNRRKVGLYTRGISVSMEGVARG
jgi:hypothetical protein